MIKWKAIAIRLSLLATLVALLHFGSAPTISFIVRTVVQMATGSKLEIDELHASPFQTRMSTGRVRLGHPEKELENLVDFSGSEIQLDGTLLLRKKFIITKGSIEGLHFGSDRLESGILEAAPETASPTNDYIKELGGQAAHGLAKLLNQRFEENFETIHVSRSLMQRWPAEYQGVLVKGKQLEDQIRQIRDVAEEMRKNPLNTLRDLPRIEKTLQDSVNLKKEIDGLKQRLVNYRKQIGDDRDQLLDAKNRDLHRIEEIRSDKKLNGRSLSQLLVGDLQGKRVDQAIDWIKWLRKTFPHPKKSLQATRGRGETIRFAGQVDQPDLLVKALRVNGHGTMDRKPYTFTGTLAGLTTQPEVYGKPAYLQLATDGDINLSIKGMIDRTQSVDHDRIIVSIPDMKVAGQQLKMDDDVRFMMDRAKLQITARVDLVGDRLSGQIKAIQDGFQLKLSSDLKSDFANDLIKLLNEDLQSVKQFEVVARISGTTKKPEWELHSDLGPQISNVVQSTLIRGYENKKAELIAKINQEAEETLLEISELVRTQETKIMALLGDQSRDLASLQTRVSSLLRGGGLRFR